jgi:hypothetical protein
MPNQLTLAFTVNVAGSSYGPAKAAAALAAVPLYANLSNDPVLGQFFGLTVASDTTTDTATTATRTVVLNMTSVPGPPTAPPPSPCNPITAVPPTLPYPLLMAETLPGFFLTVPGSPVVNTSDPQFPSLVGGSVDTVQFLSQPGVFYKVLSIAAGAITLTSNYTGTFSEDETAVLMVPAPSAISAIYSTSPLDSAGVAILPALPAGSGAQEISLSYMDSTGAGPFTVLVALMGTYPSPVTLAAGSKDIAVITDLHVVAVGAFDNSVGQITLCELSAAPVYIRPDMTTAEFQDAIDQSQLLITRGLVYLPPSYFSLSQQGDSNPPLLGEFVLPGRLTTSPAFPLTLGGTSVATTVSQVGVLAANNTITFAADPNHEIYTVATVGPGYVVLTRPYRGLNDNPLSSSATLVTPSPATEPTNAQLSGAVGEFVNPGTAVPPRNPPGVAHTMSPSPTFLSGLFAKTLQLAMAVPVAPSAIVLS